MRKGEATPIHELIGRCTVKLLQGMASSHLRQSRPIHKHSTSCRCLPQCAVPTSPQELTVESPQRGNGARLAALVPCGLPQVEADELGGHACRAGQVVVFDNRAWWPVNMGHYGTHNGRPVWRACLCTAT